MRNNCISIQPKKKKFLKFIYNSINRTKALGMNLTKELKDKYTENCKTLLREIKDLNKQKQKPGSSVGRFNDV